MPEVMSIEVDEEFDPRTPTSPFGLRGPNGELNYGMIGGIAVAIVLVILLIIVVAKPFSSDSVKKAAPLWNPTDPTKDVAFLDTFASNSEMVESVRVSLEAWAKYYTTADLEDLEGAFDLAGEQYAELAGQQAEIAASPEPGAPSIIELGPLGKVERAENIFTVRAIITWTKPGQVGSTYKWDIDMKTTGENAIVLSTVRETDPSEKQPVDFCGAVEVVAGLDDLETIRKELDKTPVESQVEVVGDVFDIKVKAWGLLAISVAGSDSEEAVNAILEDYEAIADASKVESTVEDVLDSGTDADLTPFYKSIESRAQDECDEDISNR